MSTRQRNLRKRRLKKKMRYVIINIAIIWTVLNVSIWWILDFDFENMSLLAKIFIILFAIFSLIALFYLTSYINKKMLEKERRRSIYRYR
ncbi:hypothetical protein LCGC14_1665840 [marine sediment metagenome]|uniref:Uncharacterized protein n=1 Tax=marine sediment metagenome TaxID=412755 RepID=A0A0F9HSM2_9ZZZZ